MPGAGHGGTYGEIQAGKFGKAGIAFFEYVFRQTPEAKAAIFEGGLTKDGWQIEKKGPWQ
jgi:hypothetical protein